MINAEKYHPSGGLSSMHVDLIATTKGSNKLIHGTDNGKKTACGINLTKPENLGLYTTTGEMKDIMDLTCDKCKLVIAKKQIKESNREMAAQLKAEQKALRRERAAEKHNHGAAEIQQPVKKEEEYVPPSMRKNKAAQEQKKPIDAPAPEIQKPVSMPAPNVGPAPVSAPAANRAPVDDVLAQFAVPAVPTSLPPSPAPAPAPAPAPQPVPAPADDVLAQFAIPTVPTSLPGAAPAVQPAPADDVLAQFAIPTVPTSLPGAAPAVQPAPADDVLAQFAIPTVPTSLPGAAPAVQPAPADDVLAQFAIPTVPTSLPGTAPASADIPSVSVQFADSSAQKNNLDSLANTLFGEQQPAAPSGFPSVDLPTVEPASSARTDAVPRFSDSDEIVEVTPVPAPDDYDPFAALRQSAPSVPDALDDLMVVPAGMQTPDSEPQFPTLDAPTVPTAPASPAGFPTLTVPTVPTSVPSSSYPTLNVPPVPPAPSVPQMPVPPQISPAAMPQGYGLPTMPQSYGTPQPVPGYPQAPVQPVSAAPTVPYAQPQQAPHNNLFSVPQAAKKQSPNSKPPLFVGYSADGRQLFQTYDEAGNPIPINEPVYSAPPETPKNPPVRPVAANPAAGVAVMDMDDLMASMGIKDPSKKKDEGKAINYTEYHIPTKKNKPAAKPKPASAIKDEEPSGPISAAEAKRRKKVDKINKEFEKQLRARGIDPKTGGVMLDQK